MYVMIGWSIIIKIKHKYTARSAAGNGQLAAHRGSSLAFDTSQHDGTSGDGATDC
jgi:hypothetical protein